MKAPRLALALLAVAASASAQCNSPAWQTLTYPGARTNHAAAFDPVSRRVIAFGGLRGTAALNEVIAWNGASWDALPTGPSPRSAPAMVWDDARQCAVVFGGLSAASTPLNDTWEWNGSAWAQRAVPGPSARYGPGHAFDSARARTVLFGGLASNIPQADTWLWDGVAWVNAGVSGPSARSQSGMAFDAARGSAVLSGGVDAGNVRLADTWLWDGAAWTRAQVPGPSARSNCAMAYDAARQRIVLFGGFSTTAVRFSDTWEWDGAAWTQISASGPTPRSSHTLSYDSARARCVLIEGVGANANVWTSDTWEYDGASWRLVASAVPANATGRQLIAQGAGPRLMFGGFRTSVGANNETWEWTGLVWKRRLLPGPAARCYAGLAYDPIRARTFLFGGTTNVSGGSYFGDTWEYDGNAWYQRIAAGPSARTSPLVFHAASGRSILFGGFTGSAYAADTWAWDGSTWTQLAASGPPGRSGHSLAYDEVRQRLVMYGGFDGSTYLSDTWEFDGVNWSLASVAGPGPRTAFVMGYDPVRRRTVLYGGFNGTATLRETWEWDGALWTRTTLTGPAPNVAGGMAWDPGSNRLLCASNTSSGLPSNLPTILSLYGTDISPVLTAQPLSVAINGGQAAGFMVAAYGGAPMSFQWRRNAQPLADGPTPSGSIVRGSTTPSLTIAAAQAPDAGNYDCIVSDACGGTASASAQLVILCSAPTVTLQPTGQTLEVAQSITFTIAASGTDPLTFQWLHDGNPMADGATGYGSKVAGSASAALTIQLIREADAGNYACLVTNDCGSATSDAAQLGVRCYANCDGSTTPPVLNVLDIACFMNRYAAGDPWADCNPGSSGPAPRAVDFLCFLDHFRAGCPELPATVVEKLPPPRGRGPQGPPPLPTRGHAQRKQP